MSARHPTVVVPYPGSLTQFPPLDTKPAELVLPKTQHTKPSSFLPNQKAQGSGQR